MDSNAGTDDRIIARFRGIVESESKNASQRTPMDAVVRENSWPPELNDAAYQGLAGEVVRRIGPETEADAAAILLQVLVAFGAKVGRGPHVRVEGDEHHSNLFCLLVGDTSKARKGTSWGRVRQVFGMEASAQVVSGLSTGEGLKWRVRDKITKLERDKKKKTSSLVEIDPGVLDKRLLVIEPEFAQVLRQGARAGNTLSATIRCAWDSGNLATLTKNDPVTATGAHICIIGHITSDELRAELTATDSANGFANRFLFMCVQRSKTLPFGGNPIAAETIAGFQTRLAMAEAQGRTRGAVTMTAEAREIWSGVYPTLSEGLPGLLGAVTARGEAQCIRLALLYALLDGADQIREVHLLAALAVWERSLASARFIFGAAVGDPVADEILRGLRVHGASGMTRTEINRILKGHKSAERIGVALDILRRRNLAAPERQQTDGRTVEVWRARGANYAN